ncbi:MAG TPA: VCBS repeat-containing protein [Phycisphaerae bacterium]|nr:VCBS repeat-containing protein [Phycisphaerae bacterium]HNU45519.1 VCBS repeat-containing protein [Phycisphaerae bacterium]
MQRIQFILTVGFCLALAPPAGAQERIEASDDGQEVVVLGDADVGAQVIATGRGVLYGTAPSWQNTLRMQVGALQVADLNGDGWADVVVGCYSSQSYPPYPDWENLIYYNTGGALEASPSWVSTDEVSTGDIQVGDINGDGYPDIFAANGGYGMSPSVIYWGSPTGPSTTPGWYSQEPGNAWNNYAILFDFDHDNDLDVVTANQGNSTSDPYRPMFAFRNNGGTLPTVPTWQSAETSIQNFLDFADYDGDGWEDLAVSKWANFESGIYKNVSGSLQTTPVWTTGDDDTDKGVAWADVDHNGWPDLALGHDPTLLYGNNGGVLSLTWSASGAYFGHSELRFLDVDRDGDEDLAEVHFSNGQTHIYLNDNGVLSATASWTYGSAAVGTAIAFGDINGDHWPDLVIGYSGQPCVVVFYAQPPVVPGDLDGDEDVDADDFAIFAMCLAGPQVSTPPPGCDGSDFARADLDADTDVDLKDFAGFELVFTGG